MRTRLAALLLLSLAAPSWAAEPLASIKGPSGGTVGQPILLDVSGSVSDTPLQVKVAGLESSAVKLYYDQKGKAALTIVTPLRPGNFIVIVFAMGTAEGAKVPTFDFAPWPLEITLPAPAPNPTPGPDPPTPPPPGPGPTPGPIVTGKLWAVYVLPDLPSQAEAALRASPTLRAQFDGVQNLWKSYLASESEVQAPGWKQAITAAGGPPVVLWVAEGGKVVKSTKAPTEAATVADLKALRGVK